MPSVRFPFAAILASGSLLLAGPGGTEVKTLDFVHTHTGEAISVAYKREGRYVASELHRLQAFLADHRNGDAHEIDPKLFDLLHEVRKLAGSDRPFHLVSGYRSPATNEMLRRTTTGVARKSFHTSGRAIDVRLPGVETARLRDIALSLKRGGVGFYPKSDFIHLDTGRVRRW